MTTGVVVSRFTATTCLSARCHTAYLAYFGYGYACRYSVRSRTACNFFFEIVRDRRSTRDTKVAAREDVCKPNQHDGHNDHTPAIARIYVAQDDVLRWIRWGRRIEDQPLLRERRVRRPNQSRVIVF